MPTCPCLNPTVLASATGLSCHTLSRVFIRLICARFCRSRARSSTLPARATFLRSLAFRPRYFPAHQSSILNPAPSIPNPVASIPTSDPYTLHPQDHRPALMFLRGSDLSSSYPMLTSFPKSQVDHHLTQVSSPLCVIRFSCDTPGTNKVGTWPSGEPPLCIKHAMS